MLNHATENSAAVSRLGGADNYTATVTDVKTRWAEVVKRAARRPVEITCNGKTQVVVIGAAKLRRLVEELEERVEHEKDLDAIDAYDPKDGVPFEEVRANLKRRGLL